MKFREHRGQLDQSLETLVELADRDALMLHAQKLLGPYGITTDALKVELYLDRPDERIGWAQTYIVTVPGYGVLGFTDEMPKET